jgi:hypothetical protein
MATLADALRGYVPPTDSPMSDVVTNYANNIAPQAQANLLRQAGNVQNAIEVTPDFHLQVKDPQAFNQFMSEIPNLANMVAYHGTPHEIQGAFDINKVGTGEGAQAYGHGMYFAENPEVATEYRKALSGRTDNNLQPSDPAFIHAVESFREYGTPLEQIPAEMKKAYKSATDQDIKLAIQATEKGNLYKVDIPDEHIPMMLDYDKPIKDQPALYELVRKNIKDPDILKTFEHNAEKGISGANVYKNYIGGKTDAQRSENALNMGIKGIRYLDQGSRNPGFSSLTPTQLQARIESLQTDIKSGGGNQAKMKDQLKALQNEMDSYKNMTSNFVVFDPSSVKILEENGKPLTRKELIEQQVNKVLE